MYPNLYYLLKDLFGVEWRPMGFLNMFGLLVALAFLVAAWVLSLELKRKEKQGLLLPREEVITIGKPAGFVELFSNGLLGFFFGYKLIGLFFSNDQLLNPQEYIFSQRGNFLGGLFLAAVLTAIRWWEKKKQALKTPETRSVRIWPHDRVGDIIVFGLIFGILGAKLFDNFEHWNDFIQHPIQSILSPSGLTFYGGLILASAAILIYAHQKEINLKHLMDAAAPALMIAYAVGRLGCQISGDGDWGVYNSAYISDNNGNVILAKNNDFQKKLDENANYFLQGKIVENGSSIYVTDRIYSSLNEVPHISTKAPSYLPNWLFAYAYPQNVNKDGIVMPLITDEHNKVLPLPVYPTPLYETIICSFLFLLLWMRRKAIKTPMVMFGIYLLLNGLERLIIECIRVNRPYNILGFNSTQAQLIAVMLMLTGAVIIFFAKFIFKSNHKKIGT